MSGCQNPRYTNLMPVIQEGRGRWAKYTPEYCEAVRMWGQEGLFMEEWAARIGCTQRTLYNWADRHPEFEEAVHAAWILCRAYWSEQMRKAATTGGPTRRALLHIIAARFSDTWGPSGKNTYQHFKDRNKVPEESAEEMQTLTDQQLTEKIAQLEARRELGEMK